MKKIKILSLILLALVVQALSNTQFKASYVHSANAKVTSVAGDFDGDRKTDLLEKTGDGRVLIDYAKNGFGSWDQIYNRYLFKMFND
ncbi:hypothetical protein [Clostridium felsineum]|uniref:Uncharacterized protein n=1 Tax=Clostridium felsineum TaxID=36839 RepID=A0A1S8KXK1_9CLOT|nr:hypothetical protein [Clostridium felsineum]URZ09138.1 hypothetical protein CLROS_045540 [Clostridium felsineum]URZ13825.1 hypothetical protein CROST_046030 [Clostridium felsineum]